MSYFRYILQLNECETDPDFLQLSQNNATNCLFTFVFLPVLTCFAPKIVKNQCHQNKTIFGAKGKNGEKHKSKQTIACHVLA